MSSGVKVVKMELRVLEYFLAVAREQSITRAAEYLHLTQPTLSRQLKDLERELGLKLFERGPRRVTLTEEGAFFRKRAEEIVGLANRTESEMREMGSVVSGDIYIGSGEGVTIRNILHVAHGLQEEHPGVRFHFTSGDTQDLVDRLDAGLFDFCVLFGDIDREKYGFLELPFVERWGVVMPSGCDLAKKDAIEPKELWDKPLIMSRQSPENHGFLQEFGRELDELSVACTYNLAYNGALMAAEGMGYLITLDSLVNTEGTDLCFRPLVPEQTVPLFLVWKKYQPRTKASEAFLERILEEFG